MPSLFVLGATGYIGSAVLFTWLKEVPELKVTALVRDDKHAAIFSKYDVTTVKGSNDDLALIKEYASKSDIVLNAANADADAAVEAILDGCKVRFEQTGTKPLFIHTSGVMVLEDGAKGNFNPHATWYDDRNVELLKSIPPTAVHRNVEQRVVDADEAGYVSAYIISPGSVYGVSDSPIPRVALVTGMFLAYSLQAKAVPVIGEGTNIVSTVHIKDVAAVYLLVLKHALSGRDTETGWGKYYHATGREAPWNAILKAYGTILHQKGVLSTPDLVVVPEDKFAYLKYFAVNVRAFPGRATQLGWRITQPSIFDAMEQDIEIALKAQ